jgi:cytochrome c-type biogenesis protein CcmH
VIFAMMGLVALLAVVLLTRPWWQRARAEPVRRRAANVSAYRSRVAEIESDVAGGRLDAEAAAQVRGELDAQLVVDAADIDAPAEARLGRGAAFAIVAALLLFAAGGYWLQGSWRDAHLVEVAQSDPAAAQMLQIHAMVAGLEQRLAKEPGDAEGWAMLGRSKVVMQDYDAAARAYGKANDLSNHLNPDWLSAQGEAVALAHGRDLTGEPQKLFEQALAVAPDHPRALWYAGLTAAQAHDYANARAYWLRLRAQDIPDQLRELLDDRLQAIAQATGEPLPEAPAAPAASPVSVKLHVTLADAVAARRRPGQVLYVFAKAASGPPMPLAVQRIEAPAFPLDVTLDDSMAMTRALKLSAFDSWVIAARLSSSGDPKGQAGDLEGSISLTKAQATGPLNLQINEVVP